MCLPNRFLVRITQRDAGDVDTYLGKVDNGWFRGFPDPTLEVDVTQEDIEASHAAMHGPGEASEEDTRWWPGHNPVAKAIRRTYPGAKDVAVGMKHRYFGLTVAWLDFGSGSYSFHLDADTVEKLTLSESVTVQPFMARMQWFGCAMARAEEMAKKA